MDEQKDSATNLKDGKSLEPGFTLIEILVVIAIIGILASVVLASLQEARVNAKNVKRVADVNQIALAIELYQNDHSDTPPGEEGIEYINGRHDWIPGLSPDYISIVPSDPINEGEFRYRYMRQGFNYEVAAFMEDHGNDPTCNDGGPAGCDYYEKGSEFLTIYNPGASGWNFTAEVSDPDPDYLETATINVNSEGASDVAIELVSGNGESGITNYTIGPRTDSISTVLRAPETSGGKTFSAWTLCDSGSSGQDCTVIVDLVNNGQILQTVTANYGDPEACSGSPDPLPIIFTSPQPNLEELGAKILMGYPIGIRFSDNNVNGVDIENLETGERMFWRDGLKGSSFSNTTVFPGGLEPGPLYRLIGYSDEENGEPVPKCDIGVSGDFSIMYNAFKIWVRPLDSVNYCNLFADTSDFSLNEITDDRHFYLRYGTTLEPGFLRVITAPNEIVLELQPSFLPDNGILHRIQCLREDTYNLCDSSSCPVCWKDGRASFSAICTQEQLDTVL